MNLINFRSAAFLSSAPSLRECPTQGGTEVAFAGRSNAGKSSAINTLTNNKKLARTSKTPGRTQLLNFFTLQNDEALRLVDLPGYGFAKVPLAMKQEWEKHMSEYLQKRDSLRGLVIVMDIRHPLQELDTTLLNWAVECELPVRILLTKADKLTRGAARNTLLQVKRHMDEAGVEDLVSVQVFSSLKGEGIDELAAQLSAWLSDKETLGAE